MLYSAFYEQRPRDINLNIGISDKPGNLEFYCIDEYSGRNTFDRKTAEKFVLEHPEFKIREIKTIEVKTINDIIKQYNNGIFPDLLSIDIEGLDYRVLSSADFSNSFPKVICAEITQLNNDENICELLESRGYIPYTYTIGNIIFVHQSAYFHQPFLYFIFILLFYFTFEEILWDCSLVQTDC
nr:FkbM family methyltransferase [Oxalobacter aliiformigenes]